MPLWAMATIYARMVARERLGDLAPFAERAVSSMVAEPYLVAGRNRADTALMEAAPGAVIAKGGAEALMCAALLEPRLGIAVKIRDGASRASGPAVLHVLRLLGALDEGQVERLAPFARPAVLGGGEPRRRGPGRVRPDPRPDLAAVIREVCKCLKNLLAFEAS